MLSRIKSSLESDPGDKNPRPQTPVGAEVQALGFFSYPAAPQPSLRIH